MTRARTHAAIHFMSCLLETECVVRACVCVCLYTLPGDGIHLKETKKKHVHTFRYTLARASDGKFACIRVRVTVLDLLTFRLGQYERH